MRLFSMSAPVAEADIDPQFASSMIVAVGEPVTVAAGDSAYGYCVRGGTALIGARTVTLLDDGFFSTPGPATLTVASAVIAVRHGFSCLTLFGLLERRGRLAYIDGCSDTLLIAPPVLGDPCVNYLHMPAGTRQSMHSHPSVRAGIIVGGTGWCVTPTGRQPLREGQVFILARGELHCFHTDEAAMHIVVYHPDSDFGPMPHGHPMINKTILSGGE
jgi:quercetin dioxygenase-like cupin family protein